MNRRCTTWRERIHTQIAKEPLATAKGLLRFTGSFGLALSMSDDPDWKTVYGRANAALHEAKAAGKDRISFGRSQSKNATARLKALNVSSSPLIVRRLAATARRLMASRKRRPRRESRRWSRRPRK